MLLNPEGGVAGTLSSPDLCTPNFRGHLGRDSFRRFVHTKFRGHLGRDSFSRFVHTKFLGTPGGALVWPGDPGLGASMGRVSRRCSWARPLRSRKICEYPEISLFVSISRGLQALRGLRGGPGRCVRTQGVQKVDSSTHFTKCVRHLDRISGLSRPSSLQSGV